LKIKEIYKYIRKDKLLKSRVIQSQNEETLAIKRIACYYLSIQRIKRKLRLGGRGVMDPKGILCVIPSSLTTGEEFSLKVKLLGPVVKIPSAGNYSTKKPGLYGQFNLNVSRGIQYLDNCLPEWTGVLEIDGEGSLQGPERLEFDGKRQGVFPEDTRPIKTLPGLRFTQPGFHFIRVTEPVSGVSVLSNPVYVHEKTPTTKIFWGDPHFHSFFSDGIRCPEELYFFAKNEAFLDFGAITDHVESLTDRQWDYFVAVTNDFNEPDVFATLIGEEWTSHPEWGHRNIYYRGDSGKVLRHDDPRYDTLNKLWKSLERQEAIAIPHHSANVVMGVDWDWGYNPEFEKAVEIHSVWGTSERHKSQGNMMPIRVSGGEVDPGRRHVIDALKKGRRFGFVGGGDIHDGRPGDELHNFQRLYQNHLWPQGFTAAFLPSLTRQDIYDAIKNRSTYATTKSRIYLDYKVTSKDTISVKSVSEEGIKEVVLVRNGQDNSVIKPDTDPRMVICEKKVDPLGPDEFLYVRVRTEKDSFAWSSPVWGKSKK
jgi:hypothetical protein